MPNFFRTRYRIVRDNYSGYEAQFRYWWMPFYWQLNNINTSRTIEQSEQLIYESLQTKVVKQIV